MGGLSRALLLILVFSLSFKNGQVFGRLRLAEYLLLPLGFYALLMRRLVEPGFRWRRTALDFAVCLLFWLCTVSLFHAVDVGAGADALWRLGISMALFFCLTNVVRDERAAERTTGVWITASAFLSIWGLAGVLSGGFGPAASESGRLALGLRDPNYYASYLLVAFAAGMGLLIHRWGGLGWKKRVLLTGAVVLVALNIGLSVSRGAAVSAFVSLGVLLWLLPGRRRWGTLCALAALGVISLWAMTRLDPTLMEHWRNRISGESFLVEREIGRGRLWAHTVAVFLSRPWGIGLGNLEHLPRGDGGIGRPAHNLVLEIGAELGVAGVVVVAAIVLIAWIRLRRTWCGTVSPALRSLAACYLAALTALMVQAMTLDMLAARHLWFVLGMGVAISHMSGLRPAPDSS